MGTPKHTYCSLRDLLKNQPSPPPKFKNHPCSKTKVPDLEDVYTNMPLKLSILESLSPSKKPSSQITHGSNGKKERCSIEKPPMVESSINRTFNHEKNKQRFDGEKIKIDSQEVVFASDEDEDLKASLANGAKEDAEKTDMEKEEEENTVVKSEEEIGKEKGEIKSEE